MGALKQLHTVKELSYNNIVDMEAAWNMVWEFTDPAACIIKHAIMRCRNGIHIARCVCQCVRSRFCIRFLVASLR